MKPGMRKLLVEGIDERHVILAFLRRRGLESLLSWEQIEPLRGDGPLLESIPVQVKAGAELDALGIVIDVDEDLSDRWQSLSYRLQKAGYPDVPKQPDPRGWVRESAEDNGPARLGVWLMPDNRGPGKLEDFVRALIPRGDRLFPVAQTAVEGIPPSERLFAEPDVTKATLHTWLAWQEEPGRPMGTAITAKFLNVDGPVADSFADWLVRCFSPGL